MHPYCTLIPHPIDAAPRTHTRLLRLLFTFSKEPQPLVLLQFLSLLRSTLLSSLPSAGHKFNRLQVRKQYLANPLNRPTKNKVEYHGHGELESELGKSKQKCQPSLFFGCSLFFLSALTEVVISTNCNHRFNSGTKSVAPQYATALTPSKP